MSHNISRRDFIKLGMMITAGAGLTKFNPFPLPLDDRTYPQGEIGRVALANRISVYQEPDWDSPVVGYLNTKDQLIQLYYEITSPKGPPQKPQRALCRDDLDESDPGRRLG